MIDGGDISKQCNAYVITVLALITLESFVRDSSDVVTNLPLEATAVLL